MSGVSFVSETEIDEVRKKRQEEWEKVRKEDDPLGKLYSLLAYVCLTLLIYYWLCFLKISSRQLRMYYECLDLS